jgi:hypothetical protein
VFRNGVLVSMPTTLLGPKQALEFSYILTNYTGSQLYSNQYQEIGITLGTNKGAIKKDQSWHYYNGKRWIPNNKVNDILALDPHTAWIATPEGISQIQEVEMTLDQKAAAFEERIKLKV